MNQADRLLEAHIAFEHKRWTGKLSRKDLTRFVDGVWDWASETELAAALPEELATDTVLRWVDDWYLPDALAVLIGNIAKRLIDLPVNEQTRLGDLVDDELFEAGIDLVVDMQRLRELLITRATESPLYGMLIANVLYSGLRDYLTGEDSFTKKVPVMSGLLSRGASALNKRVPGIEDMVEQRLTRYIEDNAQKTIRKSRDFLLDSLSEERIRELSDQIWAQSRDAQLSIAELMTDEEIDRLVSFGLAILQDLRQTEYIQELIREAVAELYESYGERPLGELLEHLGISRDGLLAEAEMLAPPLLQAAADTGLLDTWLRAQLAPFYASAAFRKAVAD